MTKQPCACGARLCDSLLWQFRWQCGGAASTREGGRRLRRGGESMQPQQQTGRNVGSSRSRPRARGFLWGRGNKNKKRTSR